jgi:hypothetical protein
MPEGSATILGPHDGRHPVREVRRPASARGRGRRRAVGGQPGPPADRGVGEGTEHRRQPDEDQHSPDDPLALVQGPGHGDGQSENHDDQGPRRLWRPARMLARSVSRLLAKLQGAVSHDTSSISRVAPVA